jgi:hypothetical protein
MEVLAKNVIKKANSLERAPQSTLTAVLLVTNKPNYLHPVLRDILMLDS